MSDSYNKIRVGNLTGLGSSRLRDRLNAALSGRYVLDREIGGGGMSSIFVAQELALGRDVVMKVLPPELAAAVSEERFRREVLVAARLQHPHIVPIHSAGEADGLLYYTMPLVEGETLRARLTREGELPVSDAIRVLSCVADAMAYAHSHGVVHRDIKPENILLTGQYAVVTDFGIAKALGDAASETSLTKTGIAIGTAAYMAPEQVAADPSVDHRVDIYALGIVAYELLAGAPPFSQRTAQQIASAHMTEQPEPITKRRPAVSPGLATLVMNCLEKRPADRPQSAETVVNELSQLAVSGGQAAGHAAATHSRRPMMIAALVILAVASALVAGIVINRRGTESIAPSGKRVVVAALTNETGDKSVASFGKMAADWVTQGLQETGFIDVVDSRTVLQASQQLTGTNAPVVQALAKQTGAAIVIWGSYYNELDSLIIRAQIVDASDGKVLRSVSVGPISRQTPTVALETLRDQVLAALAPLVDPRLATWETSLKPPSYAAYRVYMDGLENYVAQNEQVTYVSSAIQFARAVQLDSTFQTARLWQAFTLFLAGWTSDARFLQTTDSVLQVLDAHHGELSPADRRFYNWVVALRRGDMPATYVTAKEMMTASPSSSHAIWETALGAIRTNRPKEGLALLERPELTSGPPGSLSMKPYATWKAAALHLRGDYDAELEVARAYSLPESHARAYAALGNGRGALEVIEPLLQSNQLAPGVGMLLARLTADELTGHGQIEAARTLAIKASQAYQPNEGSPFVRAFNRLNFASVLYSVGRFKDARTVIAGFASMDSAAYPTVPIQLYAAGLIGLTAARTGDRATAQRILSELEARKLDPLFKPIATYSRARLAAALGDDATAVTLVKRAITEGFLPLPAVAGRYLHSDPELRSLLSRPDLKELLQPKN
ncbi:MAG TPA: serine/threonine-protein kinase [Gemmatimonadaceae bacterium]|nr:serine/threonine-protein kinase [Gemmatimonadaceae bacterium]